MLPTILALSLSVGAGPSQVGGPESGRQASSFQRGMSVEELSRALREKPEFIMSVRGTILRTVTTYQFPKAAVEVDFINDRLERVTRMKR
jgi:hypothetical protein